jgi:plastocyanin
MYKFLWVFLLLLTACGAQPRTAVTVIDVTLTEYNYSPQFWRIPGGQTILLKLTNEGKEKHDWTLLKDPPTAPFNTNDEVNVLFRASVAAGEIKVVEFKSPVAPGEYFAVCSTPDHMENGMSGKVLVVQPGY